MRNIDNIFLCAAVCWVVYVGLLFYGFTEELKEGVICKEKGGVLVTQLDGTYICAKLEVIK